MNHGLTLLEIKNIFGDQAFSIFDSYGTIAGMSDFAIATGGGFNRDYLSPNSLPGGWWWTQTPAGDNDVQAVSYVGYKFIQTVDFRYVGVRPALPLSNIPDIFLHTVRGRNNIVEIEYGWYPQQAAPSLLQKQMLELFYKDLLDTSDNTYTIDSRKYNEYDKDFKPQVLKEYIYQNKRYVCHKFNSYYDGRLVKLSNHEQYQDGDFVFYEAQPVKWLVDLKAGWAITKDILVAGVQFNNTRNYQGDFLNTNMNRFLQECMAKDLFQISTYSSQKKESVSNKKKNNNPYNLSFDKVSEEEIIKGCIEARIAPYLHAPSGDGKSDRIHQLDPDCEIIYLVTATPESINGKSAYNAQTGEIIDVMPSWLKKINEKCAKEPDKTHIVFFDEFTNAPASIQKLVFNIVLDKEVNGKWKLPKNCAVAAAGNETKDSSATYEMVEPMFNRFAHVYIDTTVETWLDWATKPKSDYQGLEYQEEIDHPKIHPAIYSFVAFHREKVLRTPYTGKSPNANPRKWELASNLLYQTGKPEMLRALIGKELTESFCSFCHQSVITLEDVIHGNYEPSDLEMDMATSMATIASLSSCEEKDIEVVRNFVKYMSQDAELTTTFDSLWSHGNSNRLEKIAELKMEDEILTKEKSPYKKTISPLPYQ